MAKKKNKKAVKILLVIIAVIIVISGAVAGANYLALGNLIEKGSSYFKSFFKVV